MPMGKGTYGSQKGRPPEKDEMKRKKKMGGGKNMKKMDRSMYYGGSEVARPN
jgi:hypothetical protein|tara:strand:- start:47 stop:202 length:156 start_codon:yes stop_codon:yes gene_type:complete